MLYIYTQTQCVLFSYMHAFAQTICLQAKLVLQDSHDDEKSWVIVCSSTHTYIHTRHIQVKFMLEGSNDEKSWVVVGSSTFWTLGSTHQFLNGLYETPLERGKMVAFNMECPWYTMMGYFLTWFLFGTTFLLMFIVSMLNAARFGKHAFTLGFVAVGLVSLFAGWGYLQKNLIGDAIYFFWSWAAFFFLGISMVFFEKYFDIVWTIFASVETTAQVCVRVRVWLHVF